MFAFYQSVGSVPVVSDFLSMMDSGILIVSANSFRTRGGRPFGSGDLPIFSFFIFIATTNGSIVQVSIVLKHIVVSSGMSPSGSLVNTEEI